MDVEVDEAGKVSSKMSCTLSNIRINCHTPSLPSLPLVLPIRALYSFTLDELAANVRLVYALLPTPTNQTVSELVVDFDDNALSSIYNP